MRGVVAVSTRALTPAFGLRSSALLAPPQRVKASQLAVKQLNAYVEGEFDAGSKYGPRRRTLGK